MWGSRDPLLEFWDSLNISVISGTINQLSINQSINTFITRHSTEACATVRNMPKPREMS